MLAPRAPQEHHSCLPYGSLPELWAAVQVVGNDRSQLIVPGTALAQFSVAVQECVGQREAAMDIPFLSHGQRCRPLPRACRLCKRPRLSQT